MLNVVKGSAVLIYQAVSTAVIGVIALVVAVTVHAPDEPIGVLPLVIGLVLLATSAVAFVVAARRRTRK